MTVSSQVGIGSRFCFSVRVAIARTAPTQLTHRSVVGLAPDQPTYRILIVEDMPKNRELLADLLHPIGFEVKEACNGLEAVEICQQWRPDLVWMDLRMPVMDGYEATRQIKASQNPPVVIALTGSAFKQEKYLALEAGCAAFISKPFRTEVIFEKMAELLGVQYIYKSATALDQAASSVVTELTHADMQSMPPEWVAQLRQAATRVDSQEIYRLLEEIPSEQAKISSYISQLVENFRFEEIVNLTNQYPDT